MSFASIYEEYFTAAARLGVDPESIKDADRFRRRMNGMLDDARRTAQKSYSEADVNMADLAASALLDEIVHVAATSGNYAQFQGWAAVHASRFPNIGQFAGEQVFKDMDSVLDRPDSNDAADLLEIHFLCMLLGLKGAFGVRHFDLKEKLRRRSLEDYKEAVSSRIKRIRERPVPAASPVQVSPPPRSDKWTAPLVITCAAALLAWVIVFVWFRLSLSAEVGSLSGI